MKKFTSGALLTAGVLFSVLGVSATAFAAGPAAVNLGSAGNFAVLAKSAISTTGATSITGNIGVSPAAASFITGFGLIASTDTTFATTPIVVGNVYAANYTAPTPTTLTTAVSDMQTAYTDAAGRTNPTATELGAGNLGGLTIAPGLYKWGTGVVIPTNVTLSGGANDVWIFQIAQTLTVSSGAQIVLSGGAQASNIFWVVGGQATIGTTANFSGTILGQTAIVLNTGAALHGRALAQTAVTLDTNAVTPSAASVVVVVPTPTPTPTPIPTPVPVVVPTPTPTPSPLPVIISTNSGIGSGNGMNVVTPASEIVTNMNMPVLPAAASFGQQVRAIAVNLAQGNRDNEIGVLQNFLISQNKGPAAHALMNVGATSYFGSLTRAALAEFQANVGISPALGNFGPITRAYLSTHQ